MASAVVLAAALLACAYVVAAKRQAAPSRELARAVRLLDRILAYDDAVTALPSDLREEAKSVTAAFYKELNP
ncbi:MAG TPA: hypothetical protein VF230_02865 [Acidimicrobiales bacterium]